ncbi:TRAP transporter permease [Wohlfahrtiimonas chitiniclastica]|uniref:TRAP transporter permease n=1 Tax=Wohlfahrtiimonas chitiniclastica TaxID=400946 RepID=A0AB35C147_9GAMM|nr:TRAP transporter permease [Wohlfahrtiimonas chitiniclastica]MBS7817651.1 TRAP transporter permease [Wohlfahrtiimonas chitiniclastica]MBS7819539.1 TRAP transporter permease [Wohlfahrtiimonas chitiniclastica]MBS7823511.1 TRAP transporter permease [Wohlfahrtiimonas chitiniclastica]MBS7825305.1 TRAP transporter permease [Wohlfahrtiimonas chitiniclastica]MBS7827314.1 TRAP transporter permease [Wohlfahrtiimonas chitiniclastica]
MTSSASQIDDGQRILEKFDRESLVRNPASKNIRTFIALLALTYSLFHLVTTYYPIPQLLYRAAHVAIGLALIFLIYPSYPSQNRTKIPLYDWALAAASLASFAYLWVEYDAIMNTRGGIPNTLDIAFGMMTVALVIDGARRVMGWILPILALVFLLYPFISHYDFMPDRLLTRPYDLGDIFGQMYLKMEGLYSTAIGASVSFIFLFILFGAFLAKSGMGQLFNDLALAIAGHKQGGPAKVAVISSGFMGSINGSAVGNVVGTGVFTIPMMKRVGYNANFAGAVEASASVGGQILPPIMGASAFIMAETTGVKYSTIALAAFFPALLYYLGVIAQVHFRAGRDNLKGIPKADLPRVKEVLLARGHLLIPIFALVYFLSQSVPINFAAFYTIVISIIVSQFRPETRMSPKDVMDAMITGAKQSLPVMAACAVVGIIIGTVSLTGFASVMISMITSIGKDSLFLTLFLTMLASMVLGMGLPSIPAYIITATMAAPAIAGMGVPVLVAHLFVFYFGLFANITPPVALASFAGAGIAGGDPMKTGWQSLKLALAGFIVPFMFVYNPAMLYIDTTGLTSMNVTEFPAPPILSILLISITSIVGVISLSAAVEGYFKAAMNPIERIVLAIGALMLIVPESYTDIAGMLVVAVIVVLNYRKMHRLTPA